MTRTSKHQAKAHQNVAVRHKAAVKQGDLTRYLRAWQQAGYDEPCATIQPDGTVLLQPSHVAGKFGGKNDWD